MAYKIEDIKVQQKSLKQSNKENVLPKDKRKRKHKRSKNVIPRKSNQNTLREERIVTLNATIKPSTLGYVLYGDITGLI
jgi:hypothetical protein